jgi:hypothetical protein
MDYIQKCISPREKTAEEIGAEEYRKFFQRGISDDDLTEFEREYNSRRPIKQIRMNNDNFLCRYCYSRCVSRCSGDTSDPDFNKRYNQPTYTNTSAYTKTKNESFLMFHIRVLFCLE